MRLSFIGAAHEVTGSCHLLEACGKNILIDCGMEQGPDLYENQKLPVSAGDVDYVLLTHAHICHSRENLACFYAKSRLSRRHCNHVCYCRSVQHYAS